MGPERLQKILSAAGVASRRKAESLIIAGLVTVNGKIVTELGTKADPERDHIKVKGKLLRAPRRTICIALNKPDGFVTTTADPQGRRTVLDLVKGLDVRVYPVGRLDYHSEGLLLLTNDGELANAMLRQKDRVPKTYLVKANGALSEEQQRQFRDGLMVEGHRTAPAKLRLVKAGANPWYEVVLHEGRQNQIRLMFRNLGRLVEKLRRTKIAFLDLGPLKPGDFRLLTPAEVERFHRLLRLKSA